MRNTRRLGHIYGLSIFAMGNVFPSGLILTVILAAVGLLVFDLGLAAGLIGALLATLLHYGFELFHNIGHAWMARRTGYPMSGMLYWTVLGRSLYPRDEPDLPSKIHLRRALGGPLASLLLAGIGGLLYGSIPEGTSIIRLLAGFILYDNLIVFFIGSTILRALRQPTS